MTDIMVELLAQQPVLSFQCDDTGTQLIYRLKQRGVRVHQLALVDIGRRKKFMLAQAFFKLF